MAANKKERPEKKDSKSTPDIRVISHNITDHKQADDALRESEEKYRILFEESFDGLFITSPGGKILDMNKKGISMFGYDTKEEILRLDLEKDVYAYPPDRKRIVSMVNDQGTAEYEVVVKKKNGEKMVTYCSLTAVKNKTGEITSYRGIIRDITERKNAEIKVQKLLQFQNSALMNANVLLFVIDPNGIVKLWNKAAEMITGYQAGEVIGSNAIWRQLYPENEYRRQITEKILRIINDDNFLENLETTVRCRNGNKKTILWNTRGMTDETGRVSGYIAIGLDITGRRETDEKLQKSEEKFRNVFDWANDAIMLHTLPTKGSPSRFIDVNQIACRMLGYNRDEMLTIGPLDIVPAELHPMLGEIIQQAATQESVLFETLLLRKDGTIFPVESNGHLVIYEGKKIWVSNIRDISKRKQTQEELAQVNRALRLLSNTNKALVHITDEVMLMNEICRLAVEMGGYRMAWIGFAEQDEAKTVRPVARAGFDSGYIESARLTWAENSPRGRGPGGTAIRTGNLSLARNIFGDTAFTPWREEALLRGYKSVIALPLNSKDRTFGVLGIYSCEADAFDPGEVEILKELADDLAYGIIALRTQTDEKKARKEIYDLNDYNRSLIEASLDPLITISKDGKIQDVNTATEKATGLSRADLIGTDFSEYFTDLKKARDGYNRVFSEGKVLDYPLEFSKRNGSVIPVLYNATVYHDSNGDIRGVFAAARDITERRQAEEIQERLISELARKNAELDRFTYTVSHDLKSPLLSIQGFLSLLEKDMKSGNSDRVQGDIRRITESTKKLERMITTLLALSRSGKSVDTPVKIPFKDIVLDAVRLLEATLRERGVTPVIPDTMSVISGDRQRLVQVMTNLLDNAVKFMGDQNEPRIEIGVQNDGGTTIFFVKDNGMGIRKDDLPKVFGLYERFNPDIPGTGIGLATVKRIIEAHGGKIWVESEGAGKGTTFRFTLPVVGGHTDNNNNG